MSLRPQMFQQAADTADPLLIQSRCRLIQQHQRRLFHTGTQQPIALPFPSGQGGNRRIPLDVQSQQTGQRIPLLFFTAHIAQRTDQLQIFLQRPFVLQHRLFLGQIRDLCAAHLGVHVGRHLHVAPATVHAPHRMQEGKRPQQSRLSTAAVPKQQVDTAGIKAQFAIAQQAAAAKVQFDRAIPDHGHPSSTGPAIPARSARETAPSPPPPHYPRAPAPSTAADC